MDDANAQVLGTELQKRYEILEKLGAGGFGTIYKARQVATGQTVAIKVLHLAPDAPPVAQEKRLARFQREMQLCARVHHPNIVRLIDSGRAENGVVYTVFEFAPGKNLAQVLAEEGALEPSEARHLMIQLLDALASAHTLGVIHRDFKPANIMVVPTGARRNALVVDFGIGVLTEISAHESIVTVSHESIGTPAYAAPEQLRGLTPAPRSDLYAWGLIFLECLTGRRVIEGATPADVIFKQLSPEPIPIPAAIAAHPLGDLLRRVTVKEAEARNVTAEGLLKELEALDLSGLESLSGGMTRPREGREELASAETATVHQPSPSAERLIEGERRQITALCCGLSVSSLTGASADTEALDQLLGAQQDACTAIVRRFDGLMAGAMGDIVLFYFGYPTAREDDAQRAARAALEIAAALAQRNAVLEKERQVHIKAQLGLHTGMVVARELRAWTSSDPGYVVGSTPKTASQISALVQPGTIAVSSETERLLRKHFILEPLAPRLADGTGTELALFQLCEEGNPPGLTELALVGRERELDVLLDRWNQVGRGTGQGVLLSGEPGIGKSRLAREFQTKLDGQPHTWLECRGTQTSANSPFYPIIDLLERMLDPTREASTEARLAKLEAQLSLYGFDLAEVMPLFAPLLSLPLPARWPPLDVPAHKQKELTRNAILSLFFEMAEQSSMVLLIEDLHWVDPSTLELLGQLLGELSSARVFALFSARPEFTPPWGTTAISLLQLGRLARPEIERMALKITQDRPLPPEVLEQIALRTDGVPLFIEELIQTLTESGTLVERDGRYVLTRPLADIAIPATLRDSLVARLDRLGRAKETAQVASAIGREFTIDLLRAVSPLSESALDEDLNKLVSAELVSRKRRLKSAAYLFKHALVRDAAYDSMLKRSRQQVHARITQALEQKFLEVVAERPDLLAHHHAAAEQKREALGYAQKAAMGALIRSANAEAIAQATQALGWLDSIEAPRERAEVEVGLNVPITAALMSTQGWMSPRLKATVDRSYELLDLVGDHPHVAAAVWVLALYYTVGGHGREKVRTLLARLQSMASRTGDLGLESASLSLLGYCDKLDGRLADARAGLERILEIYDPVAHRGQCYLYGQDSKAGGCSALAAAIWYQGYPEQALAHSKVGMAWAQELNHATSISLSIYYHFHLLYELEDRDGVLRLADIVQKLADRHGLVEQVANINVFRGWAQQDPEALERNLSARSAGGHVLDLSYFTCILAETEAASGRLEAALTRLERSLELAQQQREDCYLPMILRRKGLLLLERDPGAHEAAEACFRRAIELARAHGAKMHELQATTALSQVLLARGRHEEAGSSLEAIYGVFTEGFETPQLREARGMLDALKRASPERSRREGGEA
jgi:TOMM system kinase/cyclase fusion protein